MIEVFFKHLVIILHFAFAAIFSFFVWAYCHHSALKYYFVEKHRYCTIVADCSYGMWLSIPFWSYYSFISRSFAALTLNFVRFKILSPIRKYLVYTFKSYLGILEFGYFKVQYHPNVHVISDWLLYFSMGNTYTSVFVRFCCKLIYWSNSKSVVFPYLI